MREQASKAAHGVGLHAHLLQFGADFQDDPQLQRVLAPTAALYGKSPIFKPSGSTMPLGISDGSTLPLGFSDPTAQLCLRYSKFDLGSYLDGSFTDVQGDAIHSGDLVRDALHSRSNLGPYLNQFLCNMRLNRRK